MECAQINISGGSGSATPSTVSLPGAYAQNDPGILINIYSTLTTYEIPGPTPFVCGAAQGSTPEPSSSVVSVKPTTLVTSVAPTATAAGTGAALYAQCGGTG
jgi:cellulase